MEAGCPSASALCRVVPRRSPTISGNKKPGWPSHRPRFPSKRISLGAVDRLSGPCRSHSYTIQRLMPDSPEPDSIPQTHVCFLVCASCLEALPIEPTLSPTYRIELVGNTRRSSSAIPAQAVLFCNHRDTLTSLRASGLWTPPGPHYEYTHLVSRAYRLGCPRQ